MYHLARFTALAIAIGLVGCKNDDAPTYANVSGTVTYNGTPLEKGTISFATDGRAPSSMDIVGGKYTGQAMIGSNKVSVSAFRKSTKVRKIPDTAKMQMAAYMNKSGGGGSSESFEPDSEDFIPAEYGRESKQIRVVEKGGANTFDFNIKGDK